MKNKVSSSIGNESLKVITPLGVLQDTSYANMERRKNLLGGKGVQHIQNTLPQLPNLIWLKILSQLTFKKIRKVKHLSQALRDFSNYFNQNECPTYRYLNFRKNPKLSNEAIVNEIERPTFAVKYIAEINLGRHSQFSDIQINRIMCALESKTYKRIEVLEVTHTDLRQFQNIHKKLISSKQLPIKSTEAYMDQQNLGITCDLQSLKITEDKEALLKKQLIDTFVKLNERKNSIDATRDYIPTNSELMQLSEGAEESIFQKIIGVAIYCERMTDIKWLLKAGMSANVRNTDDRFPMNWPAFHIAAQIEYAPFSMAKLLLEAGADITAFDASGMTALHRIVHCELSEYSNINLYEESIKTLKDIKDSNIDLYKMSIKTLKDMIRSIFKKDPNCVHAIDAEGNTPLQYAVQYSPAEIVGYLIVKGSDITAVSKQGKNLLHLVHSSYCNPRVENETRNIIKMIVHCLEKEGRNYINTVDHEGNTPLHYAVRYESLEIIELLIEKGAHIDAVNNKGENLLQFVQKFDRKNRLGIENFLINKGLSLSKQNAFEAMNVN